MNKNLLLRQHNILNLKIKENLLKNFRNTVCIIMCNDIDPSLNVINNFEYSRKFNYNFICYRNEKKNENKNENENKLACVLLAFKLDYSFVIYLKNSKIITDFENSLDDMIKMTGDETFNLENDFIIFKNTIKTIQFIKSVYKNFTDDNLVDDNTIDSNKNNSLEIMNIVSYNNLDIANVLNSQDYLLSKKYLSRLSTLKEYTNGQIISNLFLDFYNSRNKLDILFVRTPTTGGWLDDLCIDDETIIRILYDTKKVVDFNYHKSTIVIESDDLLKVINNIGKKFDIICLDPFHEYLESIRDISLLVPLLKEDGILLCHDCFSINNSFSQKFEYVAWSGVTFKTFIRYAYNNPELYYGILNIDTGIGIISRKKYDILKNSLNKEMMEKFFLLYKNNINESFHFLKENSEEIINIIHLESL